MASYSKQEAREIVQARFDGISPSEFQVLAATIRSHVYDSLSSLMHEDKLHRVLSYHASVKWHEIDLTPLELEFADATFDYVPLDPDAPMPTAPYDVILVPLYGFDSDKYRLGHGSGWFDRFLPTQGAAYKLGIGLEQSRIDFKRDTHDIPLDKIITEALT